MPFVYIIGSGGSNMQKADLTSQVDGSTQVFTVPEVYASGSLRVYWNGVRQVVTVSYTETSSSTFTTQFTPQDGDYLTIDYIRG